MAGIGALTPGAKRRAIILISAAHFISHLHILLLPPLFVVLAVEFDVSFTALGIAITVFNIATTLTQAPVGVAVDRFGAKSILMAGLVLSGLAFILIGLTGSYIWLLVLMAVAGVANSVYHPADYALLTELVDKPRMGRVLAIHTFAGFLGSAAAPLAMAAALAFWTWRAGAIAGGVAALLVAFSLIFMATPGPARRLAGVSLAPAVPRKSTGWRNGLPVLTFLFLLIALSTSGIQTFTVAALADTPGLGENSLKMALSVFLIAMAVGVLAGGILADRTRHHEMIAIAGFACAGLLILPLAFVSVGAVALTGVYLVSGFLLGLVMPSRDMLVQRFAGGRAVGKTFGIVTTGFNAGGMIGPPMYGLLVDAGQSQAVFLLSALIMFCTALLAATCRIRPPEEVE